MSLTRRRFILALLGCLQAAAGTLRRRDRSPAPEAAGLAQLFGDVGAAIGVGEAYLRALHADDLLGHLLSGAGIEPGAPWTLRPEEFRSRRRQDFAAGDTELMEGWIMARSELCVCGLIAYAQRTGRAA